MNHTPEQLYTIAQELSKLSGMAHHQGSHTADEWQQITGTDPRKFAPEFINIRPNGLCLWTAKAEQLCNARTAQIRTNYAAIGV